MMMMMMMSSFTRIIGTIHCNYVLLLLLVLYSNTTTQILLLIKDSKILRIVKRSFVFFVFEEVSFSLGTAVPLFDVDVPSALDEPFDDSY